MAASPSAKSAPSAPAPKLVSAERELDSFLQAGALPAVFLVTSGRFASESRSDATPVADPRALLAAARRIEQAALAGGDRALDYVQIDYLDGDHQATGVHWLIAQELRSTSLFGGRRVVTVVHAETFSFGGGKGKAKRGKAKEQPAAERDPIERLLEQAEEQRTESEKHGPPWVLLVLAEKLSRDSHEFKALSRAGVVVEVEPFSQPAVQAYLEREAARYQIRVDRTASQLLWDRLGGADASRLRNAADRMLLLAGPKGHITEALILAEVPMDRDAAIWAMTDAIQQGDRNRLLQVLHMLVGNLTSSEVTGKCLSLLGSLASHYLMLSRLRVQLDAGVSGPELAARMNMKDYPLRKAVTQLRAFKPGQLELALAAIAAADPVVKGSAMGSGSSLRWMEHLLFCLLRGQPLRLHEPTLADAL